MDTINELTAETGMTTEVGTDRNFSNLLPVHLY
jgi:hypothetical protein